MYKKYSRPSIQFNICLLCLGNLPNRRNNKHCQNLFSQKIETVVETCAYELWCHSCYEFFTFMSVFSCFHNFVDTLQGHSMNLFFEVKYQTRKTVFDHISEHREDKLKISCAAEYFWRSSRCLKIWTLP